MIQFPPQALVVSLCEAKGRLEELIDVAVAGEEVRIKLSPEHFIDLKPSTLDG
ncbi:MAG: hypothetical protein AAF623_20180 [Planctomycetota bacterium]